MASTVLEEQLSGGSGGRSSDLRAELFSEALGVAASKYAVFAWVESNPLAARYLRSLKSDEHYAAPRALFRFFRWLRQQPGWMQANGTGEVEFALQKQGRCRTDRQRAELEELLLDFLNSEIRGTRNYKLKFYNAVHGLLKFHRVQLPNSSPERIIADTEAVEGSLSLGEVYKIIGACKPRERAIFTMMFQGFMDEHRFVEFNKNGWAKLEPQIRENHDWWIFKWSHRKKNDKPYFVIWHRSWDGPKMLQEYLKERGTPRRIGTDERGQPVYEPIFLNRQGLPFNKDNLQHAWIEASTRAGVVERIKPYCKLCGGRMQKTRRYINGASRKRYECRCGNIQDAREFYCQFFHVRYGKHLHELRDTLKTNLPTLAGVDRVHVNFFAGHKIDSLDYEKLREAEKNPMLMEKIQQDWLKTEPFLNLWSHGGISIAATQKQQEMENDITKLKAEKEDLRRDVELLKKLVDPAKFKRI